MFDPLVIATLVFLITYAVIISEKVHKTAVALAGAIIMILIKIIDQEHAFEAVDFNVIFLLAGMMMIANIMRKTGIFQWMAIRSAKLAKGDPFRILLLLSLVTAVASAFLDNVTTVVLLAPVTLFLAGRLDVNPVPFLISEILASNIGGTATLIGDPPNILIGSAAGLDFIEFIKHLSPIVLVILLVFMPLSWFLFGRDLHVSPEIRSRIMSLDEREVISDPVLLRKSLIVLGLTIVGFVLHGALGYEPATMALAGATALIIWGRQEPHEVLQEVEWTTLFFFVGLFIVVGAVVEVGLISLLAQKALDLTQGNLPFTTILLLWMSALLSGIIDNIPYTATMIPLVQELGQHMPIGPLWWALALGACLGGNLTIIAASANVLVSDLAERGGHPITFRAFLVPGAIVTFVSIILSTVYLWLRYLL